VRAGVTGSKTSWRAVARPTTTAAQVISVTRTLSVVKQALSLSAPASAETGRAFTLSGYGYPVRSGRVVVVQRLSGGKWTEKGRVTQSLTGRFSLSTRVGWAYRFSYRAVALSWHGVAAVASQPKLVSTHPPYILFTPAAAIPVETLKVTGKLPGVALRTVWVQRKSGTRWVTLAKATTTSTGSYATSFRASTVGSYSVRTLAPRVTIAGRIRAQYVTAAKTLRVVAQSASLSMPATLVAAKGATAKLLFGPVRAGRAVALQVVKSGVWTAVATGKQYSTGTAFFSLTAGTPGSYSYRAWTAAADGAPWFASPTRTLVITPPVAIEPLTSATTLASSSTATSYDMALTLTASVAGASGTPTGEVKFTDASNGSVLAVEPLSGGVARLTTAALAPGTRKMVVTYSGDDMFLPSVSTPLVVTVAPPQKTMASGFQNNSRHDGMATGETFNPATLHQAWSINLTDPSGTQTAFVSYPLIAGGRVFVTAANVNTNVRGWTELYALDAITGSVDWHTQVSNTSDPLGLTYDGGQVFVQTGDANRTNGHVTAYDASNGHINWTTSPGQREINSPPSAYDGVLYVVGTGSGGTLYALSEANGQLLWSAGVWNGDISSPAVDDSGVYVTYGCDLTHGFDLDGTERWPIVLPSRANAVGQVLRCTPLAMQPARLCRPARETPTMNSCSS
jgi:outer membrane protein assembly factor BamB